MLDRMQGSGPAVNDDRSGAAPVPPASATPEGVVILGMHRSGTSLITRLVSLLGLAVSRHEDLLVAPREANLRGHWESRALRDFNDQLLDELGGTWFCPPLVGSRELSRLLDRHGSDALARLAETHPVRPWVWKDPRTCVLLPFWSAVLEQRAAYVVIVRHPLEVNDSLGRRNGYAPLLSLALWERYTRQAMLGAAGRPTMVCTYDGVLADPVAWCERLGAFLARLGLPACAVDRAAVDEFAIDGLRHSHKSWSELRAAPDISAEQVQLAEAVSVFVEQASYAPPDLPAETPGTEAVFEEIRSDIAKRGRERAKPAPLPSHLATPAVARSNPEEASMPPLSVVLGRGGAASEAAALTLGPTLPPGSEVLLFGEEYSLTVDWSSLEEVSLRQLECDRPSAEAEALALGAQAAHGRMVLLTSASLLRCDQWFAPFKKALGAHQVGGVGPAMRFTSDPDRRYLGRSFADEDLVVRPIEGAGAEAPVPAALLFAAHGAYNRKVLTAGGGVDEAFSSACSAIAELSLRLWRMGFRCRAVPEVEVWSEDGHEDDIDDDVERLHDRLRIATLHFDGPRLRAFTERASGLSSYEEAAERLAASDVERRRAAIAAVCAFPIDRYFESFPLALTAS
jgi:hypothetical protein